MAEQVLTNWQHSDTRALGRPFWRNGVAPSTIPFAGGCIIQIEGDVLRITFSRASKQMTWFAVIFSFAVASVSLIAIPDPLARVFGGVIFPFCSLFMFSAVIALQKQHERLGDYLVVDRAYKQVLLPRIKKVWAFDQIIGFQWICGRTRHDGWFETSVELNLLVRETDNVFRYHVMGNPWRSKVRTVLDFSGFTLMEINLGRHGRRDADIKFANGFKGE